MSSKLGAGKLLVSAVALLTVILCAALALFDFGIRGVRLALIAAFIFVIESARRELEANSSPAARPFWYTLFGVPTVGAGVSYFLPDGTTAKLLIVLCGAVTLASLAVYLHRFDRREGR